MSAHNHSLIQIHLKISQYGWSFHCRVELISIWMEGQLLISTAVILNTIYYDFWKACRLSDELVVGN